MTTGSAFGYYINEVDFKGTVNPNGAVTEYWFEYGTTESLGSSTEPRSLAAGTNAVTVEVPTTGLLPRSTYYYRVVAKNSFGKSTASILNKQTSQWYNNSKLHPTKFPEYAVSSGTASFEFPEGTIACSEEGNAYVGNKGGAGDWIDLRLSKCQYIAHGEVLKNCAWSPTLHLDGGFKLISGFKLETECGGFNGEVNNVPGFAVGIEPGGAEVPIWGSSTFYFGKLPVKASFNTVWAMSGLSVGGYFTWA